MRLLQYLKEYIVKKQYAGRNTIVSGKTIVWIYITYPELRGLLWVAPDGITYLNNKKIGKSIKPDMPKATHKRIVADVLNRLNFKEYITNGSRDFIEEMYEQNARGRIVEDKIYIYPSDLIGIELRKYDKLADKAINMIYKYIDEKYTVDNKEDII